MSAGNGLLFMRREKKYMLTAEQAAALAERLEPYTQKDAYGEYSICNVYYDSDDYQLIRDSLEKPKFKQKMRLRSYGIPNENSTVFLELKKKYKGIVYKRRIKLPYSECMNYLEKGILPKENGASFREIDFIKNHFHLKPKVYLAYDRTALVANDDPSLRITFDYNVRARSENSTFDAGDYGVSVLSPDKKILELKLGMAMPDWLVNILGEMKIYPASFSKYGTFYREHIVPKKD